MKNLILLVLINFWIVVSNAQTKIGPFGFEPTAVELDSNNVIWIGTGSSGGVFRCDLNNNKCEEFNNPFGPANITWLQKIDKKLFVNADKRFYVLNEAGLNWIPILDSNTTVYLRQIQNAYFTNEIKKLNDFKHSNKYNVPRFINSIKICNDTTAFMCSKYGIYKLDIKSGHFNSLNIKINAADIFQIVKSITGDLIVLTHDRCLYQLKSNNWKKIFSYINYDSLALFADSLNYFVTKLPGKDDNIYENGFVYTGNDKVLYTVDNRIFCLSLKTGIFDTLYSPFLSNIVESFYLGDTIVSLGNLKMNTNYYSYNKAVFINGKWVTSTKIYESYSLPLVRHDSVSGRAGETLLDFQKKYLLLYSGNNRYFFNNNYINHKVLSYFFDRKYLYLGSSGSGLLKINLLRE